MDEAAHDVGPAHGADLDRLVRDAAPAAVVGRSVGGVRRVWAHAGDRPGPGTVFRIASLTKPVTAAATVVAARRAGVPLTTPVLDLLPDLRPDWRADPTVTLADVLAQVSGLRPAVTGEDVARMGAGDGALLRAARAVAQAGSDRPPGVGWEYYNGNYFLAGAVLTTLHGTTYERAVQDLVIDPWGLTRTGFDPPADLVAGTDGGRVVLDPAYPRGRRPSGGLCSSVSDLLTLTEGLMADAELLGQVGAVRTPPGAAPAYGLGWAVGPAGQLYLNGRLPGYRAVALAVPRAGLAVVGLAGATEALPALARAVDLLQRGVTGDDVAAAIEAFAA